MERDRHFTGSKEVEIRIRGAKTGEKKENVMEKTDKQLKACRQKENKNAINKQTNKQIEKLKI